MTINWHDPKIYTLTVSPVAADIDGLAHTNNTVYAKWCEQIAWLHSDNLGLGLVEYQQQDRAMAIIKAEYEYLAATYQGEELLLSSCLANCDMKIRLQRHFQLTRPRDNAVIFRACWQFSCIEISSGKPKRMPQSFKDIYGSACLFVG